MLSFPKQVLNVLRHGIIEIVGDPEVALSRSELSLFRPGFNRHQLCYRLSSFGDDDFFSHGYALEQAREMSLCLVDIDFHQLILAKSWTKSIRSPLSMVVQ